MWLSASTAAGSDVDLHGVRRWKPERRAGQPTSSAGSIAQLRPAARLADDFRGHSVRALLPGAAVDRQPGPASRRRPDSHRADRYGRLHATGHRHAGQPVRPRQHRGRSSRCGSSRETGKTPRPAIRCAVPATGRRSHGCDGREQERRRERRRRSSSEHGVAGRAGPAWPRASCSSISPRTVRSSKPSDAFCPGRQSTCCLALQVGGLVVRGRVLRCSVTPVGAAEVCYRGAVAFDRRIWWSRTPGVCGSPMRTRSRRSNVRVRTTRTTALRRS